MNSKSLRLDQIVADGRLRAIDGTEVERLAVSMAEVGMLQPIEVMPRDDGRFDLVLGGHRLAAATQLAWTTIDAIVFEGSRDKARLHEIDENLYRRGLSPYDEAAFLTERADVCGRLGLIPKHGGARRGVQGANLALRTFADEVAGKFGISRRDAFRSMARRRGIADDAWALIAGTKIADNGSMLDTLIQVPREKQRDVVEAFRRPLEPGEHRESFAQICHNACGWLPKKQAPSRERRGAFSTAWKGMEPDDKEWAFGRMSAADRALAQRIWAKEA